MTITEFLLARIEEDEKVATEAKRGSDGQWWVAGEHEMEECVVEGDTFKIYDEGGHDAWQAAHIARHDPARVLAECAAKRRVLETLRSYEPADEWYVWKDMGERGNNAAGAVRVMAAIYASHPDYRQEWAL